MVKTSNTSKSSEAARLTRIRKMMGLSMRALAKEWDVSHATVSQWENGSTPIPGPVVKLIEMYEQKLKERKK